MASRQLVGDAGGDVIETVSPLAGKLREEYDLEQQVAQFAAQRLCVALFDRGDDFVGFFQRIARQRLRVLLPVPGAIGLRIPQPPHDFQQPQHSRQRIPGLVIHGNASSYSDSSMPAVAPQIRCSR
jgi:hypothetical protein